MVEREQIRLLTVHECCGTGAPFATLGDWFLRCQCYVCCGKRKQSGLDVFEVQPPFQGDEFKQGGLEHGQCEQGNENRA